MIQMRLRALLLLLAAGLAGCAHKPPAPLPQSTAAPPLPPSSMTQTPAVPHMPPPAEPRVGVPGSDEKASQPEPPPAHHPHRTRKRSAPTETAPVTTASTAAMAGGGTAAAPAVPSPAPEPSLGQLSAGSGADSRERAAMNEQIHTQEARLARIKTPLSDDAKEITLQVQAFLAKARQAVLENDLDGAQTLTTKARVLLDELAPS